MAIRSPLQAAQVDRASPARTPRLVAGPATGRSQALPPIQELQQTIGNRAVVRLLQKKDRIQRATETGLAAPSARGRYSMEMNSWRNAHVNYNPPVPVAVLIDEAVTKAEELLDGLGIPKPQKIFDPKAPGSLDGQFRAKEWTLLLNPDMVGPNQTALELLTNDQLLRVVSVVFHEVRHCEQYYNMARFLAGTGVAAAEIASTLDIPEHVATAAHANPLTMIATNGIPLLGGGLPSLSPEYFEAMKWYRQVYGKLGKYTQGIYDTLQELWSLKSNLKEVIKDPSRADLAFEMDTTIQKWKDERIPTVFAAYKASIEASPFKFEMDEQALHNINVILPAMKAFIALWDGVTDNFTVLKPGLEALDVAVEAAYEALVTEKDAHVLGDQVTDTFKTLAGI